MLIDEAVPFETDATNNSRSSTVEVTEHELVRSNVLVQALGGYGAQFNQHVYAPVTNPPVATLPDFEAKVKALEPQLVRIFYNDDFEERQPNRVRRTSQSFKDTVKLAHEAGATINITYQAVDVAKTRSGGIDGPLRSRARGSGRGPRATAGVRWVTVGERAELDRAVTMAQYEALYRALDAELVARGLDEQIKLMGGDLISSDNQRIWFQYIAANMSDVLDAYSVHIYWDYWDTPFFMESRLKDVRTDRDRGDAGRSAQADLHHGVRGPRHRDIPGEARRRVRLLGRRHPISPHEHRGIPAAVVRSRAQSSSGSPGRSKWDAYWGKYERERTTQLYAMIGPASEGWPLFPAYHALAPAAADDAAGLAGSAGVAVGGGRLEGVGRGHSSAISRRRRSSRTPGRCRAPDADGARLARPRPEHGLQPIRLLRTASAACRRTRRSTSCSGTRPGTARTRSPARSRPTRPASPASRCRCKRRSR